MRWMLWGPGAGLHCTHMAITQKSSVVFLLKDRRLEHLFTSSIPHSLKVAWGQGGQHRLLCFLAPSALENPCSLGLGCQHQVSLSPRDTSSLQSWLQPEVGTPRNVTLGTRDITTAQSANTPNGH